jgi:hypothetical protein
MTTYRQFLIAFCLTTVAVPLAFAGSSWEDTSAKGEVAWRSVFDGKKINIELMNKTASPLRAEIKVCFPEAGCIIRKQSEVIAPNGSATVVKDYPSAEDANFVYARIIEQK